MMALRNITADWGRAAPDWKVAMNQFVDPLQQLTLRHTSPPQRFSSTLD